jgi:hypothetical protein
MSLTIIATLEECRAAKVKLMKQLRGKAGWTRINMMGEGTSKSEFRLDVFVHQWTAETLSIPRFIGRVKVSTIVIDTDKYWERQNRPAQTDRS